jgi:polyribonucleotide 5'-hydroxyl-kinase
VELDQAYRDRTHAQQLHAYMYGQKITPPPGVVAPSQGGETIEDFTLAPSSTVISFGDLQIYRIGEGGRISSQKSSCG